MHTEFFDYCFEGKTRRCDYSVVGDRIVLEVDGMKSIAYLEGMPAERLARVLAHELLVRESFLSAARVQLRPARKVRTQDRSPEDYDVIAVNEGEAPAG